MARCIVTKSPDGSLKLTLDEALPELDAGERFFLELELSSENSPAHDAQLKAEKLKAELAGAREEKKNKKDGKHK